MTIWQVMSCNVHTPPHVTNVYMHSHNYIYFNAIGGLIVQKTFTSDPKLFNWHAYLLDVKLMSNQVIHSLHTYLHAVTPTSQK